MTVTDLDSALLELTDAQINAALVRRAQAKAERVRQQSAERMARLRERKCYANGDASVTPDVTQEKRHSTSKSYANGDASVTPDVTQNSNLPPQVSPSPPSSPTGRENLSRGTVDELRAYAVERGLPASDGEWLHDKMLTQGWKVDGRPVKDWQALTRVWQKNGYFPSQKPKTTPKNGTHFRTSAGGDGRPATIDRNAGTANAGRTNDYSRVGKVPLPGPVPDPQRHAVVGDADGSGHAAA